MLATSYQSQDGGGHHILDRGDILIIFNSLPVAGPLRITSDFGPRNTGISGASTYHKGVDLGRDVNKADTPILAVAAGKIDGNYWNDYRGWVITINHGDFRTLYQHLKVKSALLEGTVVEAGQQIGLMGDSTNPKKLKVAEHLHFELLINDAPVDPEPYLKNIKPEESDMTEEQVREIVKEVLNESKTEPSLWAQGSWQMARSAGIVDGTNPQAVPTREQVAAMIVRALAKK